MSAIPTAIVPVIERTFTGQDAYFDGNRSVELAIRKIEGTITLRAVVKIEWDEVKKDDFHYIICQNTGDHRKPENYLRFRGDGTSALLECGTWDGGTNFNVGCPITQTDTAGDMDIIGLYDGTAWKIYINGNLRKSETNTKGAIGIDNAHWYVGAHNYRPYPRYFKGYIYYVAIYDQVLTLPGLVFYSDNDNNGYIHSDKKNPKGAEAEEAMNTPCARRLTYFNPTKLRPGITFDDVPADYRKAFLRIENGGVSWAGWQYKFEVTGGTDSVLQLKRQVQNPPVVPLSNWQNVEGTASGNSPLLFSTLNGKDYTDLYWVETVRKTTKGPADVSVKLYLKPTNSADGTAYVKEIKFQVQEAPVNSATNKYEWVVPSGWTVTGTEAANAMYTTPTPATPKTIGPQTEGSGWIGSEYDIIKEDNGNVFPQTSAHPRGDMFTTGTYADGFTLDLDYEYLRNTSAEYPTAYIQPDKDKDEVGDNAADPNKLRAKEDMFSNSGVKFYGYEIQICNTADLMDGILLPQDPNLQGQNGDMLYTGTNNRNTPYIKKGNNYYESVYTANCISGNLYRRSGEPDENKGRTNWDALDAAKTRQNAAGNVHHLYIDVTKKTATSFLVTVINDGVYMFGSADEMEYKKLLINVPENTDMRIFLQSHWGSGVRFSNVMIQKHIVPPDPKGVSAGTILRTIAGTMLFVSLFVFFLFAQVKSATSANPNAPAAQAADIAKTKHTPVTKWLHRIQGVNGVYTDVHGKDYSGLTIKGDLGMGVTGADKVNFDGCSFINSRVGSVGEVQFTNCSFVGADLRGACWDICNADIVNSNFTDVRIAINDFFVMERRITVMPPKIILASKDFKEKNLHGVHCSEAGKDFAGIDFSEFDLEYSDLGEYCNLRNAKIRGAVITGNASRSLRASSDFQNGCVEGCEFRACDFTSFDFGGINLTGCIFTGKNGIGHDAKSTKLASASFDDAIISNCIFDKCTAGLTLAQIKSTWNYKNGKMDGIKLPPDIQKALDEEKAKK